MLPIPQNVGGRFSVLSPVGTFPAAVAGINIEALLAGAKIRAKNFQDTKLTSDDCARYAGLHVIGMERRKQSIHVLMPYVKRLDEFARWVRQLVAESLGKKENRKGKTIYIGPTPVAAIGPEDQHSQLQLYAEGPFDKLITFVGVQRFNVDIKTPDARDVWPGMVHFGNKSFTKLIHIERAATAEALRQLKRPNGMIELNRLDERSMGELLMFFEIAVALMGELLDVNAYDQPGVELSKKLIKEALTAKH
jgi:glucose-6-phosphate isomerase